MGLRLHLPDDCVGGLLVVSGVLPVCRDWLVMPGFFWDPSLRSSHLGVATTNDIFRHRDV